MGHLSSSVLLWIEVYYNKNTLSGFNAKILKPNIGQFRKKKYPANKLIVYLAYLKNLIVSSWSKGRKKSHMIKCNKIDIDFQQWQMDSNWITKQILYSELFLPSFISALLHLQTFLPFLKLTDAVYDIYIFLFLN